MSTMTYTATCLGPVHIGTGTTWSKFDGAYEDRRWHRIELDNVLQHNIDASQLAHAMEDRDFSWTAWLRQAGIAPSQVDAYALFCPQYPEETAIREAMKNIYLEPYLPGSSVKGAIRTAVICRLAGEDARQNFSDALKRLGNRHKWLGQPVERALLGRSPNYDLMRAVQVFDSTPCDISHLAVGLAWTYTLRGNRLVEKREQNKEYKTFVEWLTPETTLRTDIRIYERLFTAPAQRKLDFQGAKEQAVRQLSQTCNDYARNLIGMERAFYERHSLDPLVQFYRGLEETLNELPDGAFLVNVGWGGGWEIKTLGNLLRVSLGAEGFKRLCEQYRLGRRGTLFPHTRRIALHDGAPAEAMGWLQFTPRTS